MRVDHGQDPLFLSHGQQVMNKVHCPDVVRPGGFFAILAQLGFHTPFRVFVSKLKTQLIVNPAYLLDVDGPALPPQQNMHTPKEFATEPRTTFGECGSRRVFRPSSVHVFL